MLGLLLLAGLACCMSNRAMGLLFRGWFALSGLMRRGR